MKVSEGLWLMNKAATVQLEHFSKSNALSWALTNGLFAMPVIYSDKEFDPAYLREIGPMMAVATGLALRRVGDK